MWVLWETVQAPREMCDGECEGVQGGGVQVSNGELSGRPRSQMFAVSGVD